MDVQLRHLRHAPRVRQGVIIRELGGKSVWSPVTPRSFFNVACRVTEMCAHPTTVLYRVRAKPLRDHRLAQAPVERRS